MARQHQFPLVMALAVAAFALLACPLVAGQSQRQAVDKCGDKPVTGLSLTRKVAYDSGMSYYDRGGIEVFAYNKAAKVAATVLATNSSIQLVNMSDWSAPAKMYNINVNDLVTTPIGDPNSVATKGNDIIAFAVDYEPSYAGEGYIFTYNITSKALISTARVPPLPDMLLFTADGSRIIVACEGEPQTQDSGTSDPTVGTNPNGQISIIPVDANGVMGTPKNLDFQAYFNSITDAQLRTMMDNGLHLDMRLGWDNATKVFNFTQLRLTAAKDVEPEYITLDDNGLFAYATLQENNAIAKVRIEPGAERIEEVWPLGFKNFTGGVDFNDRDVTASLVNPPNNVVAMYQPDTIVFARINGVGYLGIANEGDSKEEAIRVSDIKTADRLSAAAFPNADTDIIKNSALQRLTISPSCGLSAWNGSLTNKQQSGYTRLCAYGGRSFALVSTATGRIVYDSGSEFETIVKNDDEASACFNCDRNGNSATADTRSDNSGSEPEGIDIFNVKGRWYAAIGLERQGGIMLYDVTTPIQSFWTGIYVPSRSFTNASLTTPALLTLEGNSDLAPEMVKFVSGKDNPSGKPSLLVSNEYSSSLVIWELDVCTSRQQSVASTLRVNTSAVKWDEARFCNCIVQEGFAQSCAVENTWVAPNSSMVEVQAYFGAGDTPSESAYTATGNRLADVANLNRLCSPDGNNGVITYSSPVSHNVGNCKAAAGIKLTRVDSYSTGNIGRGSVEILAYDKVNKRIAFVEAGSTKQLQLVSMTCKRKVAAKEAEAQQAESDSGLCLESYKVEPITPVNVTSGSNSTVVGGPNSVATFVRNNMTYIAVALDGNPVTSSGVVRVYDADFRQLAQVVVCALPDMLTWSLDGMRIFAACEGEPSTQEVDGSDPSVEPNPAGAFLIVDVTWNNASSISLSARHLLVQSHIDKLSSAQYDDLLARGLRIDPRVGGKANAGKDIEPEYIALSDDGLMAYVVLQENNAVMRVDLASNNEAIIDIMPLGWKNWKRYALDASDRDAPGGKTGMISLQRYDNVFSWYQPDTIAFLRINGAPYLFIANEGDYKEDKRRLASGFNLSGTATSRTAHLDPTAFPASVLVDGKLGRLQIDPFCGLSKPYNASLAYTQQGPYNKVCAHGGRSFSILNAATGELVYDSGDDFERILSMHPVASECFNCDRDQNVLDARSANHGPEPEAMEAFSLYGRSYAVTGLERQSGLMVYDVTDPRMPRFLEYNVRRNFDLDLGKDLTAIAAESDLAPEQVKFVPAADSPNGKPLLLMTAEISGTLAVFQVDTCYDVEALKGAAYNSSAITVYMLVTGAKSASEVNTDAICSALVANSKMDVCIPTPVTSQPSYGRRLLAVTPGKAVAVQFRLVKLAATGGMTMAQIINATVAAVNAPEMRQRLSQAARTQIAYLDAVRATTTVSEPQITAISAAGYAHVVGPAVGCSGVWDSDLGADVNMTTNGTGGFGVSSVTPGIVYVEAEPAACRDAFTNLPLPFTLEARGAQRTSVAPVTRLARHLPKDVPADRLAAVALYGVLGVRVTAAAAEALADADAVALTRSARGRAARSGADKAVTADAMLAGHVAIAASHLSALSAITPHGAVCAGKEAAVDAIYRAMAAKLAPAAYAGAGADAAAANLKNLPLRDAAAVEDLIRAYIKRCGVTLLDADIKGAAEALAAAADVVARGADDGDANRLLAVAGPARGAAWAARFMYVAQAELVPLVMNTSNPNLLAQLKARTASAALAASMAAAPINTTALFSFYNFSEPTKPSKVSVILVASGGLANCSIAAQNLYFYNATTATTDGTNGAASLEGVSDALVYVPAGCKDVLLSTADKTVLTPVALRVPLPARGGSVTQLSPALALAGHVVVAKADEGSAMQLMAVDVKEVYAYFGLTGMFDALSMSDASSAAKAAASTINVMVYALPSLGGLLVGKMLKANDTADASDAVMAAIASAIVSKRFNATSADSIKAAIDAAMKALGYTPGSSSGRRLLQSSGLTSDQLNQVVTRVSAALASTNAVLDGLRQEAIKAAAEGRTIDTAALLNKVAEVAVLQQSNIAGLVSQVADAILAGNATAALSASGQIQAQYSGDGLNGNLKLNAKKDDDDDNTALIVGLVVGLVGGLLVIGLVVGIILFKKKNNASAKVVGTL